MNKMHVVIIEDESFAADKLERQLLQLNQPIEILAKLESVKKAVDWLKTNTSDLIFMDIHLSDGLCFRIFDEVEITTPVIFTTAYDQYAIQAFKVNSVDYLLKPINKYDLAQSIDKFTQIHKNTLPPDYGNLMQLIDNLNEKKYQSRFMVVKGEHIKTIPIEEVAYFFAQGKYAFLVCTSGERFLIDFTLESLCAKLNPDHFFRINRQMIIKLDCIAEMHTWFKRRIKLDLEPTFEKETIVASDRIKDFKDWLNQ